MDILEFIQKHFAWIIAALSLGVSALGIWLTKRRSMKAFSYRVLIDTPLVRKRDGATGKIEILYEGKPVESVRLVEIELRNSGGKEIEAKDFAEPICVSFGEGAELYEQDVVDVVPDGFTPVVSQNDGLLVLKPTLMNPGDRFVVKVLVTAESAAGVKVNGRISGVTRITKYDGFGPQGISVPIFSFFIATFVTAIYSLTLYLLVKRSGFPLFKSTFIAFVFYWITFRLLLKPLGRFARYFSEVEFTRKRN